MATDIPNLWNRDLKLEHPQVPTPVSVLRKQAESLGELTKEIVVGKVETVSGRDTITHHFSLFAPLLNYSYPLFSVTHHGVNLYPVKISVTRALRRPSLNITRRGCNSMRSSRSWEILNSEGVRRAIADSTSPRAGNRPARRNAVRYRLPAHSSSIWNCRAKPCSSTP